MGSSGRLVTAWSREVVPWGQALGLCWGERCAHPPGGGLSVHRCLPHQNLPGPVKLEVSVAQSCPTLLRPQGLRPARLLCPWDSPGKKTSGLQCPPAGDLLSQGPNQHLLHWQMGSSPLAPPGKPYQFSLQPKPVLPRSGISTMKTESARTGLAPVLPMLLPAIRRLL